MDIAEFLDLAVELETQISKLYELVADLSGDPPIASRLKAIAAEEINHANTIRHGKAYYEKFPELFSGINMDEKEAQAGVEELMSFLAALGRTQIPLVDSLKKLLAFEERFERVHIATSMKITEPSLKQLFATLTKTDQSHILILRGLIESFV